MVELVKEMTECFVTNSKNSAEISLSPKETLDNQLRNSSQVVFGLESVKHGECWCHSLR